jgi:hypothetical protein
MKEFDRCPKPGVRISELSTARGHMAAGLRSIQSLTLCLSLRVGIIGILQPRKGRVRERSPAAEAGIDIQWP